MELISEILGALKKFVLDKYPNNELNCQILDSFGYKATIGEYNQYYIVILSSNPGMNRLNGIGTISDSAVKVGNISKENIHLARQNIEKYFNVSPSDLLFILKKDLSNLNEEVIYSMQKLEQKSGLSPMKIFLSHKGIDKPTVRDFKLILETLGFSVWLDEDAMCAGTELERGLLDGFKESCAAIFFVTPNYVDENFLASEVNYAIAEKRKKGTRFSLVTLVFEVDGKKGEVPELLQPYVWKEPKNNLEALHEIIKSLPVAVGQINWK